MITVLIIIAAVVGIPLLLALFAPKEYRLERNIIIDKPKHEVFDYIKYVRNQEQYSKWAMADPEQKITMTGTDGTVGFINAWDSAKKAGAGEQEITGLVDGERITTELRFTRPFKSLGHSYMTTESHNTHSTRVRWGMSGKMPYPLNLMTAMLKGGLEKDVDISLNNLKNILES